MIAWAKARYNPDDKAASLSWNRKLFPNHPKGLSYFPKPPPAYPDDDYAFQLQLVCHNDALKDSCDNSYHAFTTLVII